MNDVARLMQLAALFLFALSAAGKEALENIQQNEYPVSPNTTFTLRLGEGTVHVYASNENIVKLTAIKKAYTQERLDGIKVDAQVSPDAVEIVTTFPPKPHGLTTADRSGTVDYILLVPQTCTIKEIAVDDGEVIVEGMRGGGLDVRLTNGRILTKNCFCSTNLTLGRGGIDIGYLWWEPIAFSVNAQSTNGDVRVGLPSTASAQFQATTADGWIGNQFAADGENNDAHTQDWTMGNAPNATFNLRAQSGNLHIEKIY